MKVVVAENCGFCPGVKNAIRMAEKVLGRHRKVSREEKNVYSLGPIIHNSDVVQRLAKTGLKTVESIRQIPQLPAGGTVLIRSHGAAPNQIAELEEKGINIVDATCVLVKRVQRIAGQLDRAGYKVVVIGDENHPEVQAVVGSATDVIVLADESDLHKLPLNGKLGIVCQTTQSQEHFSRMLGAIGKHGFSELKVINTLCKEAIKRQESAVQLCKQVDIMFVLGGLESANTRKLAELCKKYNSQTFHLQNWSEFDKNTIFGKNKTLPKIAGVTAGASTPEWIIAEFVENLTKIK
ncbi:MAG: 4-hydroxy-3-methylbut-2-enyl diphosphate reductase [Phycisphaerae bacterium]|nr:4-hydroxy-3-methylbut-2-enyl diphosphate reductase [Phycisphaerae bacterium]